MNYLKCFGLPLYLFERKIPGIQRVGLFTICGFEWQFVRNVGKRVAGTKSE